MSELRQIVAITLLGLSSLPQRIGSSSVIVIGIAGVVGVMISVLAMAVGFGHTLDATGRADRAIVIRGGSNAESNSSMSRENALTIMDAPGVKRDEAGRSIASAEAVIIVGLPARGTGSNANVTLRGVGPELLALRPEIRIIEGRMFQPALQELIVGKSAQAQFQGLAIGNHVNLRGGEWTVVGVFDSDDDAHESELLADAETVLSSYRRNLYQGVVVRLDSPGAFDSFKDALTTDPTLSVDVQREPDYYAEQSKGIRTLLFGIAYGVGSIMAFGAVFGALNSMYSAVSTRLVEIATLRAIGFGAAAVVVSVLVEALLLSLAGAILGAGLAWLFFNGNTVNTLGGNFTQIVFHLTVSPWLIGIGVVWALIIGAIGGLFPAVRAARLPVATALRAT